MELTDRGKVKRFYALKIPDFSSKSLRTIFDKHISKTAQVTTDEWKGYKPIKGFNITQISSKNRVGLAQAERAVCVAAAKSHGIFGNPAFGQNPRRGQGNAEKNAVAGYADGRRFAPF